MKHVLLVVGLFLGAACIANAQEVAPPAPSLEGVDVLGEPQYDGPIFERDGAYHIVREPGMRPRATHDTHLGSIGGVSFDFRHSWNLETIGHHRALPEPEERRTRASIRFSSSLPYARLGQRENPLLARPPSFDDD